MGSERRGRAVHGRVEVNPSGEEPTDRPRQKNAGLWEPYDGRLSRTVLREREGEVPSRHSPGFGARRGRLAAAVDPPAAAGGNAGQFLDVDVDEFTRAFAHIAQRWRGRRHRGAPGPPR